MSQNPHRCCNCFCPHGGAPAYAESDRVCSDDPGPEDPAGGSSAGRRVSVLYIFPVSEFHLLLFFKVISYEMHRFDS